MSYILDALKRADSERERGAVPGLHARQVTSPALPAAHHARNRLWLAVAAALALGAMAAGLWIWQTPAVPVRLAAVEPAVTMAPAPALPTQSVPAPTPTPAPAVATPPAVAAAPMAGTPVIPKPVLKPAAAAPAAQKQVPPTPAASATVPLLSDLPENIRRTIPALVITGVVYSNNPGQRLLLVNGLVLNQGSLAAPEVTLDEIRAKSSVFSFRETRFRLGH